MTLIAPGFTEDAGKFDLTVDLFRDHVPLPGLHVADGDGHRRAQRLSPLFRGGDRAASPERHRDRRAGYCDLVGLDDRIGRAAAELVGAGGGRRAASLGGSSRRARIGFTARFRRPRMTPGVKRLLWLAAPAAAAGGITQINLFIGQIIASTKEGAIAMLQYADRVYQLPLGVVGIAIGVVLLPELSRALQGRLPARGAAQPEPRARIRAVPDAAGGDGALHHLEEMVRVLYERGAFQPGDERDHRARARRLRARASGLRHDQGFHARLFRARGHEDADALRRRRGSGQRGAGADPVSAHRRGRHRHGGVGLRLG